MFVADAVANVLDILQTEVPYSEFKLERIYDSCIHFKQIASVASSFIVIPIEVVASYSMACAVGFVLRGFEPGQGRWIWILKGNKILSRNL